MRTRAAVEKANERARKMATDGGKAAVEEAKERATRNVNPQLATHELLRRLEALLR